MNNDCFGCRFYTYIDKGYEQYEEHYEYCILHYLKNPKRCIDFDIENKDYD